MEKSTAKAFFNYIFPFVNKIFLKGDSELDTDLKRFDTIDCIIAVLWLVKSFFYLSQSDCSHRNPHQLSMSITVGSFLDMMSLLGEYHNQIYMVSLLGEYCNQIYMSLF